MANTIDMRDLRYLNLFQKITQIRTRYVFHYNETVYFCVPKSLLSKALGRDAENIRRIGAIVKKKVRIIPLPMGIHHARDFFKTVVSPVTFKEFEVTDKEIIVTAPRQTKATLIGRNKRRLEEMKKIILSFFNRDYRLA